MSRLWCPLNCYWNLYAWATAQRTTFIGGNGMKKHIEGSLLYLMYSYWPNWVRVELGLASEYKDHFRYYSDFKQQNSLYINNREPMNSRITSGRSKLFRLQQAINTQIPIASELHITHHTTPRFRPSTIIWHLPVKTPLHLWFCMGAAVW